MPEPRDILLAALDALESGAFDYLVYGATASGVWGQPRYSEDVDLILFLPEREAHRFLKAAAGHGFAVDEDLAIQQLQVSGWARLPLHEKQSPWHLDMTLGDSPFDQSAFARRRRVSLFGRDLWVASAEDMVIYKLASARTKDLPDVEGIVRRQKNLDLAYLAKWADWSEQQGVDGIRRRLKDVLALRGNG